MRWSKVKTISSFEFLTTVKRLGYLIATFGMPVFVLLYGLLIGGLGLIAAQAELKQSIFGVVDQSGLIGSIETDSQAQLSDVLPVNVLPDSPEVTALLQGNILQSFDSFDLAREALLSDEIAAFYVIPEGYLESGLVLSYFPEDTTLKDASGDRSLLRRALSRALLKDRLSLALSDRIIRPIDQQESKSIGADGQIREERQLERVLRLVVPAVFAILLIIAITMSSGYLTQAVMIEKENKVVDILLSSVDPDELLAGKLLGLGAAGLLQVLVWLSMVLLAGLILAAFLSDAGIELPWHVIALCPPLFLLSYLFLGSLMVGTGSLGRTQQEAQKFTMVWIMLSMLPFFFAMPLVLEPNGTTSQILTWVPFSAPVVLILRLALEPEGIALWESIGAALAMLIWIWLALKLGARLFRIGLLAGGDKLRIKEVWRQSRAS